MADFAAVLAALDGPNGSTGLNRYLEQARSLSADSLTADPFITAMMTTLAAKFTGQAAELLQLVTPEDRPPRGWPNTARQVTTILRRNAPALRKLGWTVDDLGSANKTNATTWRVNRPEIARNPSSPTSPTSPNGIPGEVASQASQEYGQSQDDSRSDALSGCRLHHHEPMVGCYTCDGLANHPLDSEVQR